MKHTECEDCKLRKGDCGYHFKMDGKTNYDIAFLTACDQYGNCMFFEPKAKLQGDLISREELKKNKFVIPDIQFVGGSRNDKIIERITLAYNKGWNAAIDAIYENAPAVEAYTKDDMTKEYLKGYNACKDIIQPTGEWIPVSERLPEEEDYRDCYGLPDGCVLWQADNGDIGFGWYYRSTECWSDLNDNPIKTGKVIAWQPLPEPYKKGEEE